ncbi:MAG: response regulator [Ginsengibacter sp.]
MNTITIIDDDKELLKLVRSFLNKKGFGVSVFTDWLTAIKNIRLYQPQLVILDVFLKNFDGFEVCKRLKANPFTRHIPVLMFSGFPKVADAAIYECGAREFISKPFSIDEFMSKINHILPGSGSGLSSIYKYQ